MPLLLRISPPTQSEHSEADIATATQAAIAEWTQMYSALASLEAHFGPRLSASAVRPSSHSVDTLWAPTHVPFI